MTVVLWERVEKSAEARDMKKGQPEVFSGDDGAALYRAAAGIAAHDARPVLEALDRAFLDVLEPVVALLKRDGLTQAQALDRAASLTPRWYALKRSAWNARSANEVTRSALADLDAAREVVRMLVAKAQQLIRKGAATNEQALREAAQEAPPWAW